MAAIAVLAPAAAGAALKRSLPRPSRLVRCRNADALQQLLVTRLVDAVVVSPIGAGLALLRELRTSLPSVPVGGWAPFRPEDAAVLVEGVDDAVAADLLGRVTLAAARREALADGPRALRLSEPLQQRVWDL